MHANFLFSSPPSPQTHRAEVGQAAMEGDAETGSGPSFAALVDAMAPAEAESGAAPTVEDSLDPISQATQASPLAAAVTPAQGVSATAADAATTMPKGVPDTALSATSPATDLPAGAAGDGDSLASTAKPSSPQPVLAAGAEDAALLADRTAKTGLRTDAALAGSLAASKQPKASMNASPNAGMATAYADPSLEDATLPAKGIEASALEGPLKSPAQVSAAQALTAPEVQVTNLPDAQSAPFARTEASGAPGQSIGGQAAQPPAASTIPMDAPQWPDAIVDDISRAQLTEGEELRLSLTPERLGTLHIRLSVENGAAQIQIVAETAEAARTLQDAQPRLAEALSRVGLDLGQHTADLGGQTRDGSTEAWSDSQHQGDAEGLLQGERNDEEQELGIIRFSAQPEQRAAATPNTATRIDRIA